MVLLSSVTEPRWQVIFRLGKLKADLFRKSGLILQNGSKCVDIISPKIKKIYVIIFSYAIKSAFIAKSAKGNRRHYHHNKSVISSFQGWQHRLYLLDVQLGINSLFIILILGKFLISMRIRVLWSLRSAKLFTTQIWHMCQISEFMQTNRSTLLALLSLIIYW